MSENSFEGELASIKRKHRRIGTSRWTMHERKLWRDAVIEFNRDWDKV